MKIFYLDKDPFDCAKLHCDKHVVKMILEYGQILSTAHRILDGCPIKSKTEKGRNIKRWILPEDKRNELFYKSAFINHPSSIWARKQSGNYRWLFSLWCGLVDEYNIRYGKSHKAENLFGLFSELPKNIPSKSQEKETIVKLKFCDIRYNLTRMPQCMPDECKEKDSLLAYQKYYRLYKKRFAKWTKRPIPDFMTYVI